MKRFLLAIFLLFVCASARAEPYALAGIGAADTRALGGNDSTFPRWIGGGYRSGAFALEATYANFDRVDAIVSNGRTNISSTTWTGKGVGVFGVGYYGPFLVRAGAYRLRSEFSGDESRSESIWAPSLSIGWQTQLEKHLSARASVEYVRGKGEFTYSRIVGTSVMYVF